MKKFLVQRAQSLRDFTDETYPQGSFALNDGAERELLAAFRERQAEKIYEALCFYPFQKQAETLTAYLKKDEKSAHVRVFSRPCPGAERIRTEYEVKENFGEYSRVEIRLHSGKTHQIRAHMAFIGHPVVGDEKYGDEALNKKYRVARQVLVAKKLSFRFAGELSYLNGRVFESGFSARLPE